MQFTLFEKKELCCGCCACMNVCPKGAILMKEDENGFVYPEINGKICISCGVCQKVCAYQHIQETNTPQHTYVAVTANTDQKQSASGGAFASLATSVLADGGIVFGASMETVDGKLTPMHIGVERQEDLIKLMGSKYVQSAIGTVYREVQNYLKNGKLVLFSGTPCQVAGLKGFLRCGYDNLLTVDIICHGVPNSKFFQDYIALLEAKHRKKIVDFKFRDKNRGWGLTGNITYIVNKQMKTEPIFHMESSYYELFLDSAIYRESCYKCKYACNNRPADITIGDYWGIQKNHADLLRKEKLDESRGISCLIVNSRKGGEFLKRYHSGLRLWDSEFNNVSEQNQQLQHPSIKSAYWADIFAIYRNGGYPAVERWFVANYPVSALAKLKNRFPYRLKLWLKRRMKVIKT